MWRSGYHGQEIAEVYADLTHTAVVIKCDHSVIDEDKCIYCGRVMEKEQGEDYDSNN